MILVGMVVLVYKYGSDEVVQCERQIDAVEDVVVAHRAAGVIDTVAEIVKVAFVFPPAGLLLGRAADVECVVHLVIKRYSIFLKERIYV